MKIPKTVIIAGRIWKVITHKKERGGWYNSDKQQIDIGLEDASPERIRNTFLHEVMEAILSERLLRYKLPYTGDDNGNYVFVMNHIQFENATDDIGLALKEVLG